MYSLMKNRNELLTIINGVADNDWNKKTQATEWTVGQVTYHLAQSDEFFLNILKKEVHNDSMPTTRKDLSFVTDRSIKYHSPIPSPNDNIPKEETIAFLHRIREELISFVDQHSLNILEMKSANLGRLGVMNLDQIIEFIALHEKRHIGQINDIIEALES